MIKYIGPERPFSDIETASMADCLEFCSTISVIGVDTETSGLDFTKEKLLMVQIGDKTTQFVIDARFIDISPLKEILESNEITKIFHNVKFDYKFLLNAGIRCENTYDTMLAEQVIYCGQDDIRNNLAAVAKRRLGVELSKEVRNRFIGMRGELFTDDQIVYGAKDVELLDMIAEKQLPIVEHRKLEHTLSLENKAALAFGDIEYNGMDINQQEWLELSKEYEIRKEEIALELDEEIKKDPIFKSFISEYVQGELFGAPVRGVDVSWDSPKQALKVFKRVIPDLESADGKVLYLHRRKHPIISKYISYKKQTKIVSSYGAPFLKTLKSDKKVHTSFRQVLNTGRVSSSEPNMQQIPADNRFRNCFKAPPGYVFVSSDYSSQELNVIAYGSKDPVWLNALRFNQDLHSVCAELVYGQKWKDAAEDDCAYYAKMKNGFIADFDNEVIEDIQKAKCDCPEHKRLRTNVKAINFGLAYGMGAAKLADTIESTVNEAKALIEDYFVAFPNIHGFLEKLARFGIKYGYARTFPPFNRKRFFPGWYAGIEDVPIDSGTKSLIERASKNTPIQGTGADMTKLALIMCRKAINENNLPVKLVMTVHDQIDTIVEKDYAEEWKEHLKYLMEEAAKRTITNGLLKAEPEISDVWKK